MHHVVLSLAIFPFVLFIVRAMCFFVLLFYSVGDTSSVEGGKGGAARLHPFVIFSLLV